MKTSPGSIASLPVRIGVRLLARACLDDAESARKRLAAGRNADALHDFRVALRRLRSCLRVYRPYFDDTVRRRDRRAIRDLAAATGAARDLDVQLEWLARRRDMAPDAVAGARLLAGRLRLGRRAAGRAALAAAHRFPALLTQLEPALDRYCETIDRAAPRREFTTAAATAGLAAVAIDELEAALNVARETGDAAALHAARIAGKRVRYLFDPFRSVAAGGTALMRRFRRFQDALGELHDLDVLLELARSGAAGLTEGGESGGPALEALAGHIEAAREAAFQAVRGAWLGQAGRDLSERARAFAAALRPAEPTPADLEIERKYLLESMPRLPEGAVLLRVDQGYLPGERLIERVRRVRGPADTRYFRTVKLGGGVRRIEVEEETDEATWRALWRLTKGRRVSKRRYVVADGGTKWEIDRFVGRPLVLAEIELAAENAEVVVPDWLRKRLVREVTDEPEYLNRNLAG